MEPIDSKNRGAIGWHLIARGGDMTARVHPAMQLGVLPSGDLSFEAPNAVVQFNLAGEALLLDVVAEHYELELESGERIKNLTVGAQTHVCLDFLGHTLDIDNDFAVARPPGDALALYVVRKGEPRQALGPLSAPAHAEEIIVGERSSVTPLKAVPVDYLQREHAAFAAEKRQHAARRSNVRRVILALSASVLLVAGLVVTALYVASRSVEEAMTSSQVSATEDTQGASPDTARQETAAAAEVGPLTGARAEQPQPAAIDPSNLEVAGVSQDMFARLSALLQAEPLPDKATIDFAVESLRSLMTAYPDDPRIPAALTTLNERLVQEARQAYDDGDAFRAGRLIEQATTLGLAGASVAETLDYFSSQAPGTAATQAVSSSSGASESEQRGQGFAAAEPVVSDAESEAMLIDALAQEEARGVAQAEVQGASTEQPIDVVDPVTDAVEEDTGLDSLVESATGLALGALAVEVIVEDGTEAETDPVLEALGPVLPLSPNTTEGVDSTVQLALDNYLADSVAPESVSASELPDGFLTDGFRAGSNEAESEQPLAAADFAAPPETGPRFRPYSELEPVRQSPLVYPSRALEGAEGSIDVEFTVTETGRVTDVNVSGDAPAIFLREAVRTIRTWRFAPVQQEGEAVPVRTALRVTYRS